MNTKIELITIKLPININCVFIIFKLYKLFGIAINIVFSEMGLWFQVSCLGRHDHILRILIILSCAKRFEFHN